MFYQMGIWAWMAVVSSIVSSIALLMTSFMVPGFKITGFKKAFLAAIAIGVLNLFVRPILFFLTLPINILSLGLFTFVLNAMVLKMASKMVPGFVIENWFSAIIGGIVLAILQVVLFSFYPNPMF